MIVDSNLYWFPEEMFRNEEMCDRFLSEIPCTYGMKGYLKENPTTGKRQFVIEKPVGSENLNYIEGEYTLETQLADMDAAGVDHGVLKLSCQQEWMGLDMCKYMNDRVAAHVSASGGRMTALGVVPPIANKAVFEEIDRCLDVLHLHGFQMSAHYGELYLDDEAFAPLFSYLNQRKVTIYVHHSPVPVQYDSLTAYTNLRRSYGRCVDQCTAIGRELFSGFFEKYPNLKLVHSMLGGGFFAFTSLWFPKRPKVEDGANRFQDTGDEIQKYLRENLFFEMSHAAPWGKEALTFAIRSLGADHVLFGSSYPVRKEWLLQGADFVRSLDITEEEKALVLGGNAQRLYAIGAL